MDAVVPENWLDKMARDGMTGNDMALLGIYAMIKLLQTPCFSYRVQNINLNGIHQLKLLFDYICGIIMCSNSQERRHPDGKIL